MAATYGAINPADISSSIPGIHGAQLPNMGLVSAYTQQESQKRRMALESEKQMKLQTQMMQSQFDSLKSTADTSGEIAAQFLTAWGSSLNDIKGMYGDAAGVLKSLLSDSAIKPELGGIKEISNMMKQEYTSYKEQYAPVEQEMLASAREQSQMKSGILRDLVSGGGKYVNPEAAASRARADVGIQGELRNQAAAREMMSMGIDPSSGRFGALTRKGAVDLAGETARAMNLARQTEKTVGQDRALQLTSALNPSTEAGIALQMRRGGADILQNAGALEQAALSSQNQYLGTVGNLAGQYANLATGMAQNITNPLAEMAGYYAGMRGGGTGAGAINLSGINPMASYKSITEAPAAMPGVIQSASKTAAQRAQDMKNNTYGSYI